MFGHKIPSIACDLNDKPFQLDNLFVTDSFPFIFSTQVIAIV
ncbi:MAG: hypothetical protein WCH65_07070 [bacterium]